MGTLSGGRRYGAFLCASVPVIELMKTGHAAVYTTGLPPSVVAAAIAAVDIIAADTNVARPIALAKMFCKVVGLDKPESPIVPMIFGGEVAARCGCGAEDAGFLVTPIRPPTVPAGTSRLRFTFTAEHTPAQVAALAAAVNALDLGRGSCCRLLTPKWPRCFRPPRHRPRQNIRFRKHVRGWLAAGKDVRVLKPVISGFDLAAAEETDTGLLLAAAGQDLTPTTIDRAPRYAAPLSPDMAAALEDRAVPVDEVVDFCRSAITTRKPKVRICRSRGGR